MTRFFIFSLTLTTLLIGPVAAAPRTNEDFGKGAGRSPQITSESSAKKPPVASNAGEEFVIGTGDILAINVWKESELSKTVPVRTDGRISLPLVGEIQASGRTPRQLETELKARLKDYVSDPEVTVVVQEIRSQKFNVLGMVSHPGSFPLAKPMTVVDAIALAGGFRDFAKQKKIYVLRRNAAGQQIRLPFNYKDVIKGQHPEQNIELQANDTIVVP